MRPQFPVCSTLSVWLRAIWTFFAILGLLQNNSDAAPLEIPSGIECLSFSVVTPPLVAPSNPEVIKNEELRSIVVVDSMINAASPNEVDRLLTDAMKAYQAKAGASETAIISAPPKILDVKAAIGKELDKGPTYLCFGKFKDAKGIFYIAQKLPYDIGDRGKLAEAANKAEPTAKIALVAAAAMKEVLILRAKGNALLMDDPTIYGNLFEIFSEREPEELKTLLKPDKD